MPTVTPQIEPLHWPVGRARFAQRWALLAGWMGGGLALAFLLLAAVHSFWWLTASAFAVCGGPTVSWWMESWRLREVYRDVEAQLARRQCSLPDLWGEDSRRLEVAGQIVSRSGWSHQVFAPEDPLAIVLYDHATHDTNEIVMFAAEDVLGHEISYERSNELLEMTLGQAVDNLLGE